MMKTILILGSIVVMAVAYGFADVARPDGKPTKPLVSSKQVDSNLRISLRRDATEARLIIPKSQINELRAALNEIDDGGEKIETDRSAGILRSQTIVSGLFLSLALVFGGIWFVRSEKIETRKGKALGLIAVFAFVGATATLVFANVGPPPDASWINGKMFSNAVHEYKQGGGKIKLEVSESETVVLLIVPDPATSTSPTPNE